MKEITVGNETFFVSVKADELIGELKGIEKINRDLSARKEKYSCDSAMYHQVAEAYSRAIRLIAEAYGRRAKK